MDTEPIRLQKYLAERGVASRRHAGELIARGLVTVNGLIVTEPGRRIAPSSDLVTFDGRPLAQDKGRRRTILLYKPRGYVCSTSGQKSPTVYDLVRDIPERLVSVGRLDKESEGLLLMTDDGELVNRLTHPQFDHVKTYEVTVSGAVDDMALKRLRSRLVIDGYRIRPAEVTRLNRVGEDRLTQLQFRLREGRNRQIRKMCAIAGLRVQRLIRVAIDDLVISGLSPGQWRDLPHPVSGSDLLFT